MNFSEFKQRLGADPKSRDPDFLEAQTSGPEFTTAMREAMTFERRLEGALRLSLDEQALLGRLSGIPAGTPQNNLRWFARAAGLFVVAGIVALVWLLASRPDSMPEYLVQHYRHDGASVLAMDPSADQASVNALLAGFGLVAAPELANRVAFIKICPSFRGKGAHMVVRSPAGPVTVIYMPGIAVTDDTVLAFDDMQARLVALRDGSVAVIGKAGREEDELVAVLQSGLAAIATDA